MADGSGETAWNGRAGARPAPTSLRMETRCLGDTRIVPNVPLVKQEEGTPAPVSHQDDIGGSGLDSYG